MHELSLAVEVAHIVDNAIRSHQLRVVDRLRLTVGALACVEKNAMETALQSVLAGTPAAGAVIEYLDEPGEGVCQSCQRTVPVREYHEICPVCERGTVRVTRGQALKVSAIEGY